MLFRYVLAAILIVFLSGTSPLSAQKLIYLEGKKLNLLKLLPPPPEPGSEGEKKDILEVLEVQENRTPAEVALGIADDVLDIYRFETELGSKFKAANLPVTDAFFKRLHQDTRTYVMLSKEYWSRERPVKASKDVRPLRSVRLPTAYPSGTTLFGGSLPSFSRTWCLRSGMTYSNAAVSSPRVALSSEFTTLATYWQVRLLPH